MKFHKFNSNPEKPILHLAHANGFPPLTYRQMVHPLLEFFQVMAMPARPLWPGSNPRELKDWSLLSDDLLEALQPLGRQKIIGVGHSLGGVLTLYAALKEPVRFSHLILIDPTMLPPDLLRRIRWMKWLRREARQDLVKGALRRRRHWDNREAAFESFKGKPLFRFWKDEVLRDYVESMTEPDSKGGVRLVYPPEWEARIYKTIPTDVWKLVKKLQLPTLVIRGENSDTFTAESEKTFKELNPLVWFETVSGAGHLVPFEKPEETGRLILSFVRRQT
jgi:pimeloyl-ACP methyl ester carboxylesterase